MQPPPARAAFQLEAAALSFAVPFLSELKISWAFAAAPLHFQHQGWPLVGFGATIGLATLLRIPMNALLTAFGDYLIAPVLMVATGGAAAMLAAPDHLAAVIVGVAVGHVTDTAQVQASLCYRWRIGEPAAQKRTLRLQAFSATFGYSSGALLGGALYEHGGFRGCALLQLGILCAMALTTASLPVVRAAYHDRPRHAGGAKADASSACSASASAAAAAAASASAASASASASTAPAKPAPCSSAPPAAAAFSSTPDDATRGAPPEGLGAARPGDLTVRSTTRGWLRRPAGVVWLCDGANIACYICGVLMWGSKPTGK